LGLGLGLGFGFGVGVGSGAGLGFGVASGSGSGSHKPSSYRSSTVMVADISGALGLGPASRVRLTQTLNPFQG